MSIDVDKSNKGPLWGFDSVVGRVEILEVATEPDSNSAPVVPSVKTQRDKWNINATAYALAAKDSDSLDRFYQEHLEIANAVRERESLYQATGESISKDDAVTLATRIKNLRLSHSFDGHADYVAFLAGQCLKLNEGKSVGDVYAAIVKLEVENPPPAFPEWRGSWLTIKLAVPADLNTAFGTQSFAWLSYRSEAFARDYERKGFPPGSPSGHLFDGGSFGFTLAPESRSSQPESGAVPVVPAPDETTIAEYVMEAPSSPDHWDALAEAAAILHRNRLPAGDALQGWLVEAARRNTQRPKGTEAVKWPKNALRNYAIIEAVRALARCGIAPRRNRDRKWLARAHGWNGQVDADYDPPSSGCYIVSLAFDTTERAVVSALDNSRTGTS